MSPKKPTAKSEPKPPEYEIIRGVAQGTPEWHALRCGLITASNFNDVQASGIGSAPSKTRDLYMRKLAGEIVTGMPAEDWAGNKYTERGKAMEDEARKKYAFLKNVDPESVTFVKRGRFGGSPDSLVGDNGILEIKTMAPHLLILELQKLVVPNEHHAQCQGLLWLTEREWIDVALYYRGMPMPIRRMYRDDNYINNLRYALASFIEDLDAMVEAIKREL